MKRTLIILVILTGLTGIWFGLRFLIGNGKPIACTMEAKECSDGSFVGRIPPNCEFAACPGEKEGILVSSPKTNVKIKSPLKIEGQAQGIWFFEAQFTTELFDANNNFLGRAILTAKDDWMTENFVPFEGELVFQKPATSLGTLKFLSANPSGLPEHQKVFEVQIRFEEAPFRKVLLYYYNPEKDKDETGNIKCSRDGLAAFLQLPALPPLKSAGNHDVDRKCMI